MLSMEAMASAVPCRCGDAGAIPEVAGTLRLFDPTDVEAIAGGILQADESREEAPRSRPLACSPVYTLDETARKHEAVYPTALSVSFDR